MLPPHSPSPSRRTRCTTALSALLAFALSAAATPPDLHRHTLWVFSDELTDPADRQRLLSRAGASAVADLYVSIYQPSPSSAGRLMYEDADVAALVAGAQASGMAVWAAYGAPDWPAIGCGVSGFPLARMQEVLDYNAAQPSAAFAGVMLDVEPPEPQTESEFQDLLTLYTCIRDTLAAGGAELAVAIRFFWDLPVAWNAQTRPAHQHVLDLGLEHVVVMGYRDVAGTACSGASPDGLVCLDEDEVAYASAQGLSGAVLVGVETSDCAPGCGPEKVTFFEEHQLALNAQAALAADHFAASPGFGGFAVHRYDAAYLGATPGWPPRNHAWLDLVGVPALGPRAGGALAAALLAVVWLGRRARRRASAPTRRARAAPARAMHERS